MDSIIELRRLASPIPKPQSLVWDGSVLWVGSRQTRQIVALDPVKWEVRWQTEAPGVPYGMTIVNGELRVLCGETADDNRIVRRCIPYRGFDASWALPCPDDTGSQLGWDGRRLNISQWYPKKVLAVDEHGKVERTITAPHGICGQVWRGETLFLATTDDEESTNYFLTRIDPSVTPAKAEDIARIPFHARALAFDGTNYWSNHREQNQIVCFALPRLK
jgi:hypothetical protein